MTRRLLIALTCVALSTVGCSASAPPDDSQSGTTFSVPASDEGGTTTSAPPPGVSSTPIDTPIEATFDPNAFSTYYEIPDTGLKYDWSVSILLDPICARGFQGGVPAANKATWFHADVTNGGGCNHSGRDYDATHGGHPGTVTVVVTGPGWTCTATYYGTLTGHGAPPKCTVKG